MYQLTQGELKKVRELLIKKQEGLCDLCGEMMEEGTWNPPVVDHCHKSGLVRGVIHRNCNTGEGKVRRASRFSGVEATRFLISLGKYLEKHVKNPSKVAYPRR
jgi:hypothetical protein